MANLWLKKNPFMSMWLSTAHRVAGSFLGQATAQGRRNVKAAMTAAMTPPALKAKRRR